MQTQIERIVQETQCEVLKNAKLSQYTSWRIGGPADAIFIPQTLHECIKLLNAIQKENLPFYILGSGSNLLVGDKGFRGIIVKLTSLKNIALMGTVITAEAGVSLPLLTQKTAKEGLAGLEFAAGIPGTVGGAVRMNAGAEGSSIADVCTAVTVWEQGSVKKIPSQNMEFSYRTSAYKHKTGVILQADFQLQQGDTETIKTKIAQYLTLRKAKQPLEFPNAGSVFKNPSGEFAGKIIADTGLQGMQIGGAMISPKHANFIVNVESATALDIKNLIEKIQDEVFKARGIALETEVEFIGEF